MATQPNTKSSFETQADSSVDGQHPSLDGHAPLVGELVLLKAELEGLHQRLRTLPVIEQSKGLLMGYYGVNADTAFAILRRWSSHSNTKLREISEQVVAAAGQAGSGEASQEALRGMTERFNRRGANHPLD